MKLDKTGLTLETHLADRLQQTQRPQTGHISGILRHIKGHTNMTLRAKVINLIRLKLIEQFHQHHTIGQVAIMQEKLGPKHMRIVVEMINALCVESRTATDDAVNFVPFSRRSSAR